jgi:RNA 2',3'-cyclic 3'-phosphodiesterase
MEQVRTFIAIELPPEVKTVLRAAQEQMISDNPHIAKWVDPGSIHLTLKFLGNIPAGTVAAVSQAMTKAAEGISPFFLTLGGAGAFPSTARPQVVWIGLTGDIEKLKRLQGAIESQVSPLGFPAENRPFTAHLTLARLRDTATLEEKQKLGKKIAGLESGPVLSIDVDRVSLMRSQLTPSGAIYTRLTSVTLLPLAN